MAQEGGDVRLLSFEVRDYRNLARVEIDPPAAGLVLVGDNGHGKTNFLEAIYYLQILRAVRGTRDADVVRFGADAFHLEAALAGSARAREVGVGFERTSRSKRVRLDGVVIPRLADAVGAVPAVMFSPSDVSLIAGEPSERRRFLDIMLGLTSRPYLAALQRYRAALARRNRVLRDALRLGRDGGSRAGGAGTLSDEAGAWEPALAEHGAIIAGARRRWAEAMTARFAATCGAMGERSDATLSYLPSVPHASDAAALLRALEAGRPLDFRRGITHAGPHRDNLSVVLGGRETRAFGSSGQQRTSAIALRLLESETYRERVGGSPIFLMDDPFAELDARRSDRVLSVLREAGIGQTILAVPRASDVPSGFGSLERARVEDGTVTYP